MSHPSTGIKSTPTEVRLQHNYLQPVLKELKMPSEMLSQSPITSPISHGRKIHVKKTWVPPTKAQLSLEESEDEVSYEADFQRQLSPNSGFFQEWNEYLRQLTSK